MASSRQPTTLQQVLRLPSLLLWCAFLLLMPFYVLPGGLPQPDDAMIVILTPLVLSTWNGRLERGSMLTFRWLMWFTVWVAIVNLAWFVILGDFSNWGLDLRYPLFYLFNALVFLIALVLHQRHRDLFLRATLGCLFISVVFQAIVSLASGSRALRNPLFFDNPNQLGYYALLVACAIALMHRRLNFGLMKSGLAFTCCGYLALISASRSAVAGVAILALIALISSVRLILLGSVLAIGLFMLGGPVANAVDAMEQRMNTPRADDQFSFLEQRGYDRILANTEYLVLGAGEVAKTRFAATTRLKHAEIHSSFGTILFSYGVVGLGMFAVFFFSVLRGAPKRAMLILVPPLIYATAHQGLRFTMLWVLLALFTLLKTSKPAPTFADARLRTP